jgi:hypothetical protein
MPPDLQPVEIPAAWLAVLEAFDRHGVQFLIAGSAADAIVEGEPASAAALIVAPAPFRRNLERLASALAGLGTSRRIGDDHSEHIDLTMIVNRPAVRWPLWVAGTEVDIIGSAVGDGEFSIRVWRTRRVRLTSNTRAVAVDVEFTAEFSTVS